MQLPFTTELAFFKSNEIKRSTGGYSSCSQLLTSDTAIGFLLIASKSISER